MNLDDETLLSAYLDDELDPADRLAVEWSIESNPPLAEQYRSLVQARDAIAGLSRPAIPRDLAPVLGARLLANRRRDRLTKLARPAAVALAFSGVFGIAASLIFAFIVLFHSLHESVQPASLAVQPAPQPRTHTSEPIIPPAEYANLVSHDPSVVARSVEPKEAAPRPGLVDEASEVNARRAIAGMLEQSHVRRIRIVTDVYNARKVKDLIDLDARKNPEFGRISICEEIVIDPEFPEAVEVFAVPMDERDRRAFVAQLSKSFSNLVEDNGEASPELVTQLTEVGQVAVFAGTKAAPLVDPPHDLSPFIANRADIPETHIVEADPGLLEPARPQVANDAGKVKASKPVVKAPTELKPNDRVTVLVWVVVRPVPQL